MLRYARRSAGLSQAALAVAAGVPQSTVARIELGQLTPRLDTIERLLRATGNSVELTPVLGADEDRSLILDRLRMSPAERARLAIREARAVCRIGPRMSE
jgi:transcriptional regulator with XRE-family HTH domain